MVSGLTLSIANFIREYNGSSSATLWVRDSEPFLQQLPIALRKPILLSKLSGRARSRVEAVSINGTAEDILRYLEVNFAAREVNVADVMRFQQTVGQSVEQFATELQDLVNSANRTAILVGPEMMTAIFIQGLLLPTKQIVELHTDNKTFQQLVQFAAKVETTHAQQFHTLKRKFAEMDNKLQDRQDTFEETMEEKKKCSNCGRNNHKSRDCWEHKRCFFCHRTGHTASQCFKKKRIDAMNAEAAENNLTITPNTSTTMGPRNPAANNLSVQPSNAPPNPNQA